MALIHRKDRVKEYEKSEKERKSPWNVIAFSLFIILAVIALILNKGDIPSLFSR